MMEEIEIKKAIALARRSVEDIGNQSLRAKTYEIVLNNLLSGTSPPDSSAGHTPKEGASTQDKHSRRLNEMSLDAISIRGALVKALSISSEQVDNYFDIRGDKIEILCDLSLKKLHEEHIVFALLTLTIQKIIQDESEMGALDMLERARHKGLTTLQSFSHHVRGYPELLVVKARTGREGNIYRLTSKGLHVGKEYWAKILSDSDAQGAYDKLIEGRRRLPGKGKKGVPKTKARYAELMAEIRKMYGAGFFNNFKSVTELRDALKDKGMFAKRQVIDVFVRKQLMKSEGLLFREKKEGTWKYVKSK